MIANLIGGFISILIGVSLIGPISTQIVTIAATNGDLYNLKAREVVQAIIAKAEPQEQKTDKETP